MVPLVTVLATRWIVAHPYPRIVDHAIAPPLRGQRGLQVVPHLGPPPPEPLVEPDQRSLPERHVDALDDVDVLPHCSDIVIAGHPAVPGDPADLPMPRRTSIRTVNDVGTSDGPDPWVGSEDRHNLL